ncbi:MAG: hydrogenase maturation protease [Candidatus Acidiferrum sp.]
MKPVRIGILSVGNILMGDDGVGPFILKTLESRYTFPPNVVLDDLGTPGLGITSFFSDYDAVILIDAAKATGRPGEVKLYRKDQLLHIKIQPRVSPHDPALVEALLFAELSGICPSEVLLIGIIPESCELGCAISPAMIDAVEPTIRAILVELCRFGIAPHLIATPQAPNIWWNEKPSSALPEEVPAHVLGDTR